MGAVVFIGLFAGLPVASLSASAPPDNPSAHAFAEEPRDSVVSYLYVEPNEDGAGGGHVALRIDAAVYHYQRLPDGPFIMDRSPFAGFLFSYSRLQNRNIHELVLPVGEQKKEGLLRLLNARYIAHRRLLDRYQSSRSTIAHLSELEQKGEARVFVPSIGYFHPGEGGGESDFSRDVRTTLTADFAASNPASRASEWEDDSTGNVEDLQEERLSLLLSHGFAVTPGSFVSTAIPFFAAEGDRRIIHNVSFAWLRRMKALLDRPRSERPDRGRTVLELLASLYSLEESSKRGHLLLPLMALLNSQSGEGFHERDPGVERFRSALLERLAIFSDEAGRRAAKEDACNDECAAELLFLWNRVLEAGARWALAVRYGALAALDHGYLLTTPSYGASVTVRVRSSVEMAGIRERLKKLKNENQALKERLGGELSYSLFRKNCATELLADLEAVLQSGIPVDRPVTAGLFLPWMSLDRLRSLHPGAKEVLYRSYRNELIARDSSSLEVSTFTSRHYRFNGRDSLFFFFSENSGLMHPLIGLLNLVPAFGQTLAGIVTSPVDGASNLSRGVRGIVFSTTEIVGISIRKGTFRSSSPLFYDFPSPGISENKVERDERRKESLSRSAP